jgi:hypothetical protein
MKSDAKKISIAFFIMFACIIGMVLMTAIMLIGNNSRMVDGFQKNDSLHGQVSREHRAIMHNQDTIIDNQRVIIHLLRPAK